MYIIKYYTISNLHMSAPLLCLFLFSDSSLLQHTDVQLSLCRVIVTCGVVWMLGIVYAHHRMSSLQRLVKREEAEGCVKGRATWSARRIYDSKFNNRVVGQRSWNREDYSWMVKGVFMESPINDCAREDVFFGQELDDASW